MKNITVLIERDDIHKGVRALWRTPQFRDSHDNKGYIFNVVDRYAAMPRFFFEMSDPYNEKAHFSAWWGGIPHRSYDNGAVHDLYWLHEMVHAGEMPYVAGLEFPNFKQKMIDNELTASVRSEIQAYFEMPGLRDCSFPHDVFADRFLRDPKWHERWKREPRGVVEALMFHRRNVMTGGHNSKDPVEYWIAKFAHQNDAWAAIWSFRYDEVESAMARLREECHAIDRGPAMKNFMDWLQSPEITRGTDTPFPAEAKAFAGVYWLNRGAYDEAVARTKLHVVERSSIGSDGSTPDPQRVTMDSAT